MLEELRRNERRFRAIFEKAGIGIILSDQKGKLVETNPAIQRMLGYSGEELNKIHFVDITHPEDVAKDQELFRGLLEQKFDTFELEKRYIHKEGQIIWVKLIVSLVYCDSDGSPHVIGMVEDITSRKEAEDQLQYLANHDFLTQVPNRYALEKCLQHVVQGTRRGGETAALLLIGLDNFKLTNDILGHLAGDEILRNLVSLLQRHLKPGDYLARFAGDEFAVVLEGVTGEQAKQVAENLRTAVEQDEMCMVSTRNCFSMTISVGVVTVDGTLDAAKLLSHVDIALHYAKEQGRNRVILAKPNEDSLSDLSRINDMVNLIRLGLREDRFVLFFQPVVDVSGQIIHHEVLLRLRDEADRLISPASFIPVAEQFGLMPQVDRWVVYQALQSLKRLPDLRLFVNLSGPSLGDEAILHFIEQEILASGVQAHRIGFEITETEAVRDFSRAERWINQLRELGCAFALDDFGIGFSSFNYLRLLPVDYVKLDGSYVRHIDQDATQLALVQAIHTVAQALGKKTIAEFVENEQILETLKRIGVHYAQGYFLGKPTPEPMMQIV